MFEYLISHIDFIWLYLIPFLVVLTVLVFVHEWGHYAVARACGVKVEIFSIGFGPEIFGFNDKHGTRWKFSVVPLGGYVKMYGDMDAASTPAKIAEIPAETRAYAFPCKSVGQRAAVVFAGPAVNFIFAILVWAGMFMYWGQPYTEPTIEKVMEKSAAAQAGLKAGDHIVMLNGAEVHRFEDIQREVQIGNGEPVNLTVKRNDKIMQFNITPQIKQIQDRFGGMHEMPQLGLLSTKIVYEKRAPFEALGYAVIEAYKVTASTLRAVGQIITGVRSTKDLGGPLKIAQLSGQAAQIEIGALIGLIALLSINLGLINLFPIPLLDGGHLLFYAFEAVRGKPPGEKLMQTSGMIGLAIVGSLMIFALFNDLNNFKFFAFVKNLFS
jgi:regulator of sigma E protease